MRLVIAACTADYVGRLTAHLPLANRLLLVKADGSVLVHSDGGSYKPLNWMSPPCTLTVGEPDDVDVAEGVREVWTVQHAKSDDRLVVRIHEVLHDSAHEPRRRPRSGEGRRRGAPAAAARRADRDARRRVPGWCAAST
ncbi:hypothetical protein GCM10025868_38950 [Angustibacter aerolatus]|uniref:Endonuclease NucS N-terminal PH-like domain-containing protein n=1 Tax=Angustibacter aerolatus TaxID=1162965 RepID=A0ABQ6JPI0_9ACTN|nr:endonuclease NucS domain-containing protein [Angustibacter aerolatus]GMA88645.1 hypothetical protein GCM10025868_38950 [Angustibacter aerolatus]